MHNSQSNRDILGSRRKNSHRGCNGGLPSLIFVLFLCIMRSHCSKAFLAIFGSFIPSGFATLSNFPAALLAFCRSRVCSFHRSLRSFRATAPFSVNMPNSVSTCILRVFRLAELITVKTSSIMVTL